MPCGPVAGHNDMRVVVVGAGISGLTSAYLARLAGHDVTCVDPASRPGGLIRSERVDGFLCEVGPQAVLDNAPDTMALFTALGLRARVLRAAPEANRRLIYARGALRPLPTSPPGLLASGLLSPFGKLRLLAEPLIAARRPPVGDNNDDDAETLTEFGNRRIGRGSHSHIVGHGRHRHLCSRRFPLVGRERLSPSGGAGTRARQPVSRPSRGAQRTAGALVIPCLFRTDLASYQRRWIRRSARLGFAGAPRHWKHVRVVAGA